MQWFQSSAAAPGKPCAVPCCGCNVQVAHQAARRIRLLRPSVAASQVEQEQQVVALKVRPGE
jgi:hypothetical protein